LAEKWPDDPRDHVIERPVLLLEERAVRRAMEHQREAIDEPQEKQLRSNRFIMRGHVEEK